MRKTTWFRDLVQTARVLEIPIFPFDVWKPEQTGVIPAPRIVLKRRIGIQGPGGEVPSGTIWDALTPWAGSIPTDIEGVYFNFAGCQAKA